MGMISFLLRARRQALGLCFALALTLAAGRAAAEAFTFAQVCDPQIGLTDYKEDICSFEQAIKEINLLRPAFVLLCGDCVERRHARDLADFAKLKATFDVPCHLVPGNHDLGVPATPETLAQYRAAYGKDYDAFSQGVCRFVLFDTTLFKQAMPGETETQTRWLTGELDAAARAGNTIFLVGHYPPFLKTPDEPENWQDLPPAARQQLLALCTQYRVRYYLAGHTHQSLHRRYAGTDVVCGETTSQNTDGHALGFRLWYVDGPERIRSRFVPIFKRQQITPKPPYDPNENGEVARCRANLRRRDAAKEAVGMQHGLANGALVATPDLDRALKGALSALRCPAGGQYRINALGQDPECTIAAHRLPYFYQFEEVQKRAGLARDLHDQIVWPEPVFEPGPAPGTALPGNPASTTVAP